MANKEAVKKWVEALRSGNYKQGKGALRVTQGRELSPSEDRFCCLGVACDLAEREGVMLDVNFTTRGDQYEHDGEWDVSYDGDHLELPEAVQDWLGIHESNPLVARLSIERYGLLDDAYRFKLDDYNNPDLNRTLAEINDDVDNSFGLIANLIEAQYLIED